MDEKEKKIFCSFDVTDKSISIKCEEVEAGGKGRERAEELVRIALGFEEEEE